MKLKDYFEPRYTRISLYVIVTMAIVFVLFYGAGHVGTILEKVTSAIGWLAGVLAPVFWGFVFSYMLRPVVQRIEQLLKKTGFFGKRPKGAHGLAVAITCLAVLAAVVAMLGVLIFAITDQLQLVSMQSILSAVDSISQSLLAFAGQVEDWLASLNVSSEALTGVTDKLTGWLQTFTSHVVSGMSTSASSVASFLVKLFFAIVFSVYFMLDWDRIRTYWGAAFRTLCGERTSRFGQEFLQVSDRIFSGYIRSQVIDALIMMALISITLSIIGVRFSIVIGVFSGFGNLIPYVGPVVAYTTTVLSCLASGEWGKLIVALALLVLIQAVDANVIAPRLLGSNVDVHPMFVVVMLLIGGSIGGLVGMLFAVPVGALIKEFFDRFLVRLDERRQERNLASGEVEVDVEGDAGAGTQLE